MRPKKKISQTELAKELGVSQALVSLTLNGRAGINPDTYKHIWEHAVALGYLLKGMRVDSARAKQIGFILRAPLRLYIPSMYFGHHRAARRQLGRHRGRLHPDAHPAAGLPHHHGAGTRAPRRALRVPAKIPPGHLDQSALWNKDFLGLWCAARLLKLLQHSRRDQGRRKHRLLGLGNLQGGQLRRLCAERSHPSKASATGRCAIHRNRQAS